MAFKMKKKGFPMKGESPNKIRDYSSAMDMKKEESPAKRAGSYSYDIDEMTGKEKVVRTPTGDRSVGTGGFTTGPDTAKTMNDFEKKQYTKYLEREGVKRGKGGYLKYPGKDTKDQLTQMADAFGLSDEFPGNPAARRKATGMSREEEARKIDENIQRKVNAGEPLTEKEAEYNKMIEDYYTRKMSADSPAEMKSGFKMKSPAKRAGINVRGPGDEDFRQISKSEYNELKNTPEIFDTEVEFTGVNTGLAKDLKYAKGYQEGKTDDDLFIETYDDKKFDIREKYPATDNLSEGSHLDYLAEVYGVDDPEKALNIDKGIQSALNEGKELSPDQKAYQQKMLDHLNRKNAANSPAEMKKQKSPIEMKTGFKMKGNPYKMGKMQTASAVKMAKEAMAKMKKEESAMEMKKAAPTKAAKPDYPDIDGDGNTTESMKQAAADKKAGPNKLKKPTRKKMLMDTTKEAPKKFTGKMSTAQEAPKPAAKGKAVAKMKKMTGSKSKDQNDGKSLGRRYSNSARSKKKMSEEGKVKGIERRLQLNKSFDTTSGKKKSLKKNIK